MRRFLPVIVLAGVSVIGFIAHHTAVPLGIERGFESLEPVGQDVLRGDFEPGFLLKINKDYLREFDIKVRLPDGRELPRYPLVGALRSAGEEPGFAVARPDVFLRLPADLRDSPPLSITAVLPIKLKQTVHEVGAVLTLLALVYAFARRGPIAVLRNAEARNGALAALLCVAAVGGFLALMIGYARGPFVWLSLFAAFLAAWGFFSSAAGVLLVRISASVRSRLQALGMVVASILFAFAVAEFALGFAGDSGGAAKEPEPTSSRSWFQLPDEVVQAAQVRKRQSVMPEPWQRRPVEIQDTERAYYWHGVLHFEDTMGFRRRNGPFPDKGDAYRILIVGDSLTYGGGVAEEWTYSNILQRALSEDFRVDVINLGRAGFQVEDIFGVVQGFVPELKPNLVVYGANLNDFLPSGQGGYAYYEVPLPKKWKLYFGRRTRVTALLGRGYDRLLELTGLKRDAYDDIIDADLPYRRSFARNLELMSDAAHRQGLPPIVGLVLIPPPSAGDPRSQIIADHASSAMKLAGFDLVTVPNPGPNLSFGDLAVSAWDGHPNELAHSLIAESLYERIHRRGDLEPFRQSSALQTPQSKASRR